MFDCAEMTRRNIVFVTGAEKIRLREAKVVVLRPGGAGIMPLARSKPDIRRTVWHHDRVAHVDDAISTTAAMVRGTDDPGASLRLYRQARAERPRPAWLAALMRPAVRRIPERLTG